ncbi:hypothetical protein [Mucilaginibacter lacusdianchii]|uniref:hypothetical protein n=1 Tax=Mucilaginibacter lacusdianchii TaxID=2684211 RepID=UPI001E38AB3C|nr:hypothetical protein [Mucilaginibacter sp. JXJ CY 39]
MKVLVLNQKKYILQVFVLLLSLSVVSCSKKVAFINSTVVPAAQGKITIDKDDNNNYTININIGRLAEASRLTPPKKAYVVWMETESSGTKNLGQLRSESGFFTNSLNASLRTVTPFKPKRVFITAEDEVNIQNPGSQVVLTTKSF